MFKIKRAAILLTAFLLLTGCAPKDDLADYELVEYPPIENVTARTEFDEYDGDVEEITVFITNDRDQRYYYDKFFQLQKNVDGEWKLIRSIREEYFSDLLGIYIPERYFTSINIKLKDDVKLPLLPGRYRIWVGGGGERVPAEFTIK